MAGVDPKRARCRFEPSEQPQIRFIGQGRWTLGIPAPAVRGLGIGFALGMFAIALVALFSG